jgi:hypothetical protein
MKNAIAQTKNFHSAPLYRAFKVGREWRAKTPHGVIIRRTKRDVAKAAAAWKEVAQMINS